MDANPARAIQPLVLVAALMLSVDEIASWNAAVLYRVWAYSSELLILTGALGEEVAGLR